MTLEREDVGIWLGLGRDLRLLPKPRADTALSGIGANHYRS